MSPGNVPEPKNDIDLIRPEEEWAGPYSYGDTERSWLKWG